MSQDDSTLPKKRVQSSLKSQAYPIYPKSLQGHSQLDYLVISINKSPVLIASPSLT
ncbi:hypothetical protein PSKAS_44240 [Peribacillus sp. N1]